MAHRSNQAVASQDQQLPQQPPDDPPPPRRLLTGWATAFGALATSLILLGSGLWFVRYSIASYMLGSALAERGAEADFQFVNLDLNSAALANVRFGSETQPDATVPLLEARWRWEGMTPRLWFLRIVRPTINLRMDEGGRVSAGALDRIGGGPPGRRRLSLPAIELQILEGQALIEAPFGGLRASLDGAGVLGRNFNATAVIEPTSHDGDAFALQDGQARLTVVSRDNALAFQLTGEADALTWANARVISPSLQVLGRAPLDFARYDIEAWSNMADYRAASMRARAVRVSASLQAVAQENSLSPATWAGSTRATAASAQFADNDIQGARLEGSINGNGNAGEGRWTFAASRFAGLGLTSQQPGGAGTFHFELQGDETLRGTAELVLGQSRLTDRARADLRAALPNLEGSPVGPTFARARNALEAAANRFDLTVPLTMSATEDNFRIQLDGAAQAQAASGVSLRIAPLRQNAPALVLEWPGTLVHGAVEMTLSGGGAPSASLLLDTVDWSPAAPFEADGTLSIDNWTADGASIEAEEIGVTLSMQDADGRMELRGPTRITGPLGDGEVRSMVARLDVAVAWDQGWRVTTNQGCLPISLGGLDAAGLSFANGDLSLCPQGGAIIAGDASGNLSGGFAIQSLALNGHMSGPERQLARLRSGNITGRFSGRSGALTLTLEANDPRLSIAMAEGRTLDVGLRRVNAQAHVAETWMIDGAFESGTLSDAALPGTVSAITGSWTAQPVDGKPVIRVNAGEALLTANRPASEAERPLFNTLHIAGIDAELRDGAITASGAILLDAQQRQLALFTASHHIDEGAGAADIAAERLEFGPQLQPYEITERARGLVENVNGPIRANARIAWTKETITGVGTVRLDGVSLATATMPIVNDVRGEVAFDDLFLLTTPPGQEISVGELNPGISVTNGVVRFQLLTESRVAIENARFDFASGILTMTPTTISLGADETQFELNLRDVDATDLLQTLNVPDLTATGRVEGHFPLLLTRRSAFIQDGVLRAQGEGGTISYTGSAGESATGISRIAFDALRSFRYDALSLTLNGDLNGEIVSSIEFSGRNTGEPVDLGPMTSIPGVGRVTVRGVPFDFNVRVTAPFRGLAQTAATITDPGSLIERGQAQNGDEAVDPDASPPR